MLNKQIVRILDHIAAWLLFFYAKCIIASTKKQLEELSRKRKALLKDVFTQAS